MASNQDPVTREELYEQVWREPMLKLAQRYEVSSSYLARVCVELRVPRPERGYWAKLEYGKAPPKPALPSARPGDLTEWRAELPLTTNERTAVARQRRSARMVHPATIATSAPPSKVRRHELVDEVKQFFLKTRKPDDTGHLRPFKRHLVDIVASEKALDSALDAADTLFSALTKKGHRVVLAGGISHSRRTEFDVREVPRKQGYIRQVWSPDQATVVFIDDVPIGMTVFETSEFVDMVNIGHSKYVAVRDMTPEQLRRFKDPHYWRTTRELPSGRLAVQAFSTSWRAPWTQRWTEAKAGQFASFVPSVVKELQAIAPELKRRADEANRKAEEEHREWERKQELERQEAERTRQVKARQDARQDLLAAIASWEQVRNINAYFESAERELEQLPESERQHLRGRLGEARALVGDVDALEKLRLWKSPQER
jgi:hypothetical protein